MKFKVYLKKESSRTKLIEQYNRFSAHSQAKYLVINLSELEKELELKSEEKIKRNVRGRNWIFSDFSEFI